MNEATGKKPDLVPDDEGSVDINGFPIHWQKFGHGPTIVLLIPGALGLFVFYLVNFIDILSKNFFSSHFYRTQERLNQISTYN